MARLPLIQELLILQAPSNRGPTLKEAGLDRFRIAAITPDLEAGKPVNFAVKEVEDLLATILRQISIDDATFAKVAAEAGIKLSHDSTAHVVVSVPFARAIGGQNLPITELAASSLVMWEISLRVKEV